MTRIDLDVTAFEACLLEAACEAERAVELYHGDLLEGLGHDCFAAERERLSDRFEDALAIVAEGRLAAGDPRERVRRLTACSSATRSARRPMRSSSGSTG